MVKSLYKTGFSCSKDEKYINKMSFLKFKYKYFVDINDIHTY